MKKPLTILSALFIPLALTTAYGAGDDASTNLVINEVMASNAGVVMSPATNFDSWIEIYNPDSKVVNLAGMYLSDDESNPTHRFWKTMSGKIFWLCGWGQTTSRATRLPSSLTAMAAPSA